MSKEKERQGQETIFKNNPYPGLFICLEGIDGSGKSTQKEKIREFLKSQGLEEGREKDFIVTQEHNVNFAKGKEIQEVLDGKNKEVTPLELQQMFTLNREDHLNNLIIPALKKRKTVITDRFVWSTLVYSLLARVDTKILIELNKNFIVPDLNILLKISPIKAIERMEKSRSSATIFEKLDKLEIVSQGYESLSKNFSEQIITINGEQSEEKITEQIMDLITKNQKFNQTRILS